MTADKINKVVMDALNNHPHPKFKDRNVSFDILRQKTGIGNICIKNFNKNKNIELKTLLKLCDFLDLEIKIEKK